MCLLTYLAPGSLANVSRLADGCEANPDGFGWAIVTEENKMLIGKGLYYEAVLAEFAALRREHPAGPAMFHSRIGTAGLNDVENCHPFYVAGDERTVLAHNGILPKSVQPKAGDPRSDTRIAAESWIPRNMGRLSKVGVRKTVERWMGQGNKIVVLSVDPRYSHSAYILNEGAGSWEDDGCWYSNSSWMIGKWRWYGSYGSSVPTAPSRKHDDEPQYCVVCTAVGWDSKKQYCPFCGTCQDCLCEWKDCMCYTPIQSVGSDSIPGMSDEEFRRLLSEVDA